MSVCFSSGTLLHYEQTVRRRECLARAAGITTTSANRATATLAGPEPDCLLVAYQHTVTNPHTNSYYEKTLAVFQTSARQTTGAVRSPYTGVRSPL